MDKLWQNFKKATGQVSIGFALLFGWIGLLLFATENVNDGLFAAFLCVFCIWFSFNLPDTLELEERKKKLDKWRQE